MKVLVAVKRVVDYNVQVRPRADGLGVELGGVKMGINPFDENAVEEALRLKEAGTVSEVVAVTFGSAANQDVLRQALAMGVDRVILVESDDNVQPLAVAKLLKAIVARENPSLVILGKQAIDDDAGQTPQMLAALLGWPQGTFASQVTVGASSVQVTREVDGGTEVVELNIPAVISADLRLNSPRFVKLPNLMMAKKKPIETLAAADLSGDTTPRLQVLNIAVPPARKAGVKVASVQELVEKLRHEAGVLA